MIKIESIHIEETRGVRNLDLYPNRGTFVISGPNGSGKSGVVDAIQFALTGEIGRLQGAGTGDLSLKAHGPHVEAKDYPDASFVRLAVFIPSLGESASITRWLGKPKQPVIAPDKPEVRDIFSRLEQHRELTLARREIIKFILTEASERSRQVQALLKLDRIDEVRAALKTTENRLNSSAAAAGAAAASAAESLKRHLDIPDLNSGALLAAVNPHRKALGLPEIAELAKQTQLTDGLAGAGEKPEAAQTKETALRDVQALVDFVANGLDSAAGKASAALLEKVRALKSEPDLLLEVRREPLLRLGLELIVGPACPLCDAEWEIEELRERVRQRLDKSKRAHEARDTAMQLATIVATEANRLRSLIDAVRALPEAVPVPADLLGPWVGDLGTFAKSIDALDGVLAAETRLQEGWMAAPDGFAQSLGALLARIKLRPEKGEISKSRDFLVLAQERFAKYREAKREEVSKRRDASKGTLAYKLYCQVAENALSKLYSTVEKDFETFYQLVNQDDEAGFKARFVPTEGKLGLLVDFYGKGMFPPGAFHSEGHQDGMGVCLYLALLKQVLGPDFTFAVLDDVVMSVDRQHRRQFCKLLKTHFLNTQFIITTHEQVWAEQMRSEGLVGKKSLLAFSSWTVETGPIVGEVADVWERIAEDLGRDDVPSAAAKLRRHLEYVASDLADHLGAGVPYKADSSYDLGDLLSAVIGRQGELLKRAMKAAQSWTNQDEMKAVGALQEARSQILAKVSGEQWVINKAVHFNEWADLSKEDFAPVVEVFKQLLEQFRCSNPACGSWVAIVPKKNPVELRCDCGSLRMNLNEK